VFATHYHELTQLADEFVSVRNYNVAVKEVGDEVLFLHRLQPGGADRSYGIEVGRLAGLPAPVIARARTLLRLLESEQLAAALTGDTRVRPPGRSTVEAGQLALFTGGTHPVIDRLRQLDPDTITPLAALALLAQLAADARQDHPA
jgi:DNA mismatch repair protein MutS